MQMEEFSRLEYLTKQGEVERNLYLVVSGAVRAYLNNGDEEITIRFGYENSVINAIDSFISQKPSKLYLQALRKTKVIVLPRKTYFDFIHSNQENQKMHIEIMHQLIGTLLEREMDLLTSNPKLRYQRVLERSPQLFQQVPLKYIASYLRMTPETLSRLRKS